MLKAVYWQVIGPLKPTEDFIEEDFGLLERFMMSSATGRIDKKIKALKLDSNRYFWLSFSGFLNFFASLVPENVL